MTDTERQQQLDQAELVAETAGPMPVTGELPPNDPVSAGGQTRSQWRDVWRQFRSHTGAMIALMLFIGIILFVTIGPYLWTLDPTYVDIRARNSGFSAAHPLGTDQLGRDLLARLMSGGRVSIAVGLTAMVIAVTLGSFIGVVSGYFRAFDAPLMRLTELFLALPLLPLLLLMVTLFREPLSQTFGPALGIFFLIVTAIGCLLYTSDAADE